MFYNQEYNLSKHSMCTLKQNMYSVVGWSLINTNEVKLLVVLFKYSVSSLMFYLLVWSVVERGMLRSLSISLWICLFLFQLSFCFMYYKALLLGPFTFRIVTFSWWITILSLYNTNVCYMKSILSDINSHCNFPLISVSMI